MFLDNTLEEWGNEEADPYLSAFDDLLDTTLPEQGETISENGVDDPDPWNDTASSAPQGSACTTDHAQEAKCSSSQNNGGSRSLKRLDKCKNDIQRIAAFYPLDQSAEEFITTTDTAKYLNDVDVYNAMRAKATKKGKVKINLEWIEPILWSLNEFRWSCECKDSDETAQKRSRSCTFVELTCAIDILTGGMCGPHAANIVEKTEITKKIWGVAYNCFKLKKKMRTINELTTIAPLGFPKMPGVSRRPNFEQWPGLSKAIAAMIK